MQEAELAALTAQVLWSAFGLALLFGAIAQRTHFCTMGAVADVVNMGDWTRLRAWALAMGVGILGFNTLVGLGWFQASNTVYAAPDLLWLSHLVGGLMFGFGMVLASGCGSKTLVRVGGGSLKSLVVVLVLAVSAYATLRGATAVLRVATVDRVALPLGVGQDLPSLLAHALGGTVRSWALALGLALGGGLMAVALASTQAARANGHRADTLLAGLGLGAVVLAGWWVSGRMGFVAEHPLTLESVYLGTNSRRMESFSFVAPTGYALDWFMLFSDKFKVLSFGIVSTVGVVVGSALVAVAGGQFRWEGFGGLEDTANHLVGAVLMGVGGVTALGCTVGQGLSGVSTLSLGSFIAVLSILAGAVLALRWQIWRVSRS